MSILDGQSLAGVSSPISAARRIRSGKRINAFVYLAGFSAARRRQKARCLSPAREIFGRLLFMGEFYS